MQSTHDFCEGGKRDPGKCALYQSQDHPPGRGEVEMGGPPKERGRKAPDYSGKSFLKKNGLDFPATGSSRSLLRRGRQRGRALC